MDNNSVPRAKREKDLADGLDFLREAVPGCFLDNWFAVKKLGGGSFGTVFEIERHEDGQRSALKIITLIDSNEEQLASEVEIMFALAEQTHAVRIFDCDEISVVQAGLRLDYLLIRMELLNPLPTGRMDEAEVIRMGRELCELLSYCHNRRPRILHCDIKPSNLFVDDMGIYKLGDFGESRLLDRTISSTGYRGSPLYMSPEMYNFDGYDSRSDLYSLGLTMYALLSGDSGEESSSPLYRKMRGHRLPRLRRVSAGLNDVLQKVCSAKPEDRYQTAEELDAALKVCQTSERRRRRGAYAAVAAIVLAAALLSAILIVYNRTQALLPTQPLTIASSADVTVTEEPVETCTLELTFYIKCYRDMDTVRSCTAAIGLDNLVNEENAVFNRSVEWQKDGDKVIYENEKTFLIEGVIVGTGGYVSFYGPIIGGEGMEMQFMYTYDFTVSKLGEEIYYEPWANTKKDVFSTLTIRSISAEK